MEHNNGNLGWNGDVVDTSLTLGLPQFHRDHQDPRPHGRVCVECGCTQPLTPTWRRGPKGPGTLCNACGLKHMRKKKNANNA